MKNVVKKILVPVQLDAGSLDLAKQVTAFAAELDAELKLLHVADLRECPYRFLSFFTRRGAETYHRLTREKNDLLATWKRWLEKEYAVPISVEVTWGNWRKQIIHYANETEADIIALREKSFLRRNIFGKRCIEQLIDESPCQVVSILSDNAGIEQWKQVVIPVTDFIPETRIDTIADIARRQHMKIHLVSIATSDKGQQPNDFYFLTQTLKRLKHAGNIQVTCKCLRENSNQTAHFLRYAREIGADVLMTNRLFSHEYNGVSQQSQFLFEYV